LHTRLLLLPALSEEEEQVPAESDAGKMQGREAKDEEGETKEEEVITLVRMEEEGRMVVGGH